jgi:sugar phosphate isomerase/epimerase
VPWGYKVEGETVGKGVVDVPRCLTALLAAGYDGFLGLEYEGKEDDTTGVPSSLTHLRAALSNATGTPN